MTLRPLIWQNKESEDVNQFPRNRFDISQTKLLHRTAGQITRRFIINEKHRQLQASGHFRFPSSVTVRTRPEPLWALSANNHLVRSVMKRVASQSVCLWCCCFLGLSALSPPPPLPPQPGNYACQEPDLESAGFGSGRIKATQGAGTWPPGPINASFKSNFSHLLKTCLIQFFALSVATDVMRHNSMKE